MIKPEEHYPFYEPKYSENPSPWDLYLKRMLEDTSWGNSWGANSIISKLKGKRLKIWKTISA